MVVDELAEDDVGEASSEAAECLFACLAVGEFAVVVRASCARVIPELGDGDHVQRVVDPAVAGTREPMTLLSPDDASMGAVPLQLAK